MANNKLLSFDDAISAPEIFLCIENKYYEKYLIHHFKKNKLKFSILEINEIANAISSNPDSILIIQSESEEQLIINLTAKLKSIFGNDIKAILLSTDYKIADEVEHKFNAFIHFPAEFSQVIFHINKILDSSKSILIIDDSKLVHNHLKPPLESEGYRVLQAFDGKQGVEIAIENLPDLIILDVEMPVMNGFETCKILRSINETRETYIIMSSTLTSAADQNMGFESGVDEYITKPVIVGELLDRLKKILFTSIAGRENIILLSQNQRLSQSMSKSLSKQGFSVKICSSIREMVSCLSKFKAELVVAENHPIDGTILDFFKVLDRENNGNKIESIIILTREGDSNSKMVLNAGASAVISYPFTPDSLMACVEKTLAERRLLFEKTEMQKYISRTSSRVAIEKSILPGNYTEAFAQKKTASVFFSDIVNFTNRCERYSPSEIVSQLNSLFETIANVIIAADGDIDKFIGDACMAFWIDNDTSESASKALNSLLQIREAIKHMNLSEKIFKEDPLEIRIGINTGEVILCDIGAKQARVDLTIIGDTVNVASRLESCAKNYGVDHLVSEETISRSNQTFVSRMIDQILVKGKDKPVKCYQLLDKSNASVNSSELIDIYTNALTSYLDSDFENALRLFEHSEKLESKKYEINPSKVLKNRCVTLLNTPPDYWSGAWEFSEK